MPGVYGTELFPTEIRLRANGICNTLGRGATVVSPFIVGSLMASYQLPGVVWLMIGLVVIVVVWAWGVDRATAGWRMSPRRRRDRIAPPVYQL
jgi:putative MFS transporter